MREQPLDLRQLWSVLRRRWFAVVLAGVFGLCGGLAYAVLSVPGPLAAVQVLLPAPASADSTAADPHTQVIVATSDTVLTPAGAKVSPSIPFDELKHLVSARAESSNVLRIEVRAPNAERALQLATAVANQYEKYVSAHKVVNGLTTTIGSASLVTPPSTASQIVKYGLFGLAVGMVGGAVAVLILARRDHRLRYRDQVAAAIGVPVVASIDEERYGSVADWIRLLERFEPSALKAWTLRRVLRNLVPSGLEGQATIHVVSFVGDKAALATGPELALFAAGSGIPTRLAPDENVALEPLIAACAALRGSTHTHQFLSFGTETEAWHGPMGRPRRWDDDPALTEAHLVVSVVAVEPSRPELSSIVGPTILALSSGFAVIDDLARVALASTKAGLGIDGIVMVNPDPSDTTTGLLPDRMPGGWRTHDHSPQHGTEAPAHTRGGAIWRA